MCTVTYLPLGKDEFILTSNRDESPMRTTVIPKIYIESDVKLRFPKDELADGTWIGLSEKKRLVCLLNGGFKEHKRGSYYRMSRGIIVKRILTSENAVEYINCFDFSEIEPFTIVLVDWNSQLETYELVWDGEEKHFTKLEQEPRIWSSSSLYTEEMKEVRKDWFTDWLIENGQFHQSKILKFHQDTELGDPDISLKMKRLFVETVSTTSVKKSGSKINMIYLDHLNKISSYLDM